MSGSTSILLSFAALLTGLVLVIIVTYSPDILITPDLSETSTSNDSKNSITIISAMVASIVPFLILAYAVHYGDRNYKYNAQQLTVPYRAAHGYANPSRPPPENLYNPQIQYGPQPYPYP